MYVYVSIHIYIYICIESFLREKPAGINWKNQHCIKSFSGPKAMFLRKTRLYPPWSVYKMATKIPLYRRKGYPLYRKLYMGVSNDT